MQAEKKQQQQQPWKIRVYAKSSNFDFRFKATKVSPTWKFHRLSILLKLHKFLLRLKSDSAAPFPGPKPRRRTLRSRFLGAVGRLRSRRGKTQSVSANETSKNLTHPHTQSSIDRLKHIAHQEPVYTGTIVAGIFSFLFHLISERDGRGIIVLGSIILFYFVVLPKQRFTGKSAAILAFSVAATCSVTFGSNTVSELLSGLLCYCRVYLEGK